MENNEILIDEDIKVSFEVYNESILDWLKADEYACVSDKDIMNIEDVLSEIIEDIPFYIDCYDSFVERTETSNIFNFIIQADYNHDLMIRDLHCFLENSKLSGLKFEQIRVDY